MTKSTSDRTGTGLLTKRDFWITVVMSPEAHVTAGLSPDELILENPMRIAQVTAALKPVEVTIIEVYQEAHVTVEL